MTFCSANNIWWSSFRMFILHTAWIFQWTAWIWVCFRKRLSSGSFQRYSTLLTRVTDPPSITGSVSFDNGGPGRLGYSSLPLGCWEDSEVPFLRQPVFFFSFLFASFIVTCAEFIDKWWHSNTSRPILVNMLNFWLGSVIKQQQKKGNFLLVLCKKAMFALWTIANKKGNPP